MVVNTQEKLANREEMFVNTQARSGMRDGSYLNPLQTHFTVTVKEREHLCVYIKSPSETGKRGK